MLTWPHYPLRNTNRNLATCSLCMSACQVMLTLQRPDTPHACSSHTKDNAYTTHSDSVLVLHIYMPSTKDASPSPPQQEPPHTRPNRSAVTVDLRYDVLQRYMLDSEELCHYTSTGALIGDKSAWPSASKISASSTMTSTETFESSSESFTDSALK